MKEYLYLSWESEICYRDNNFSFWKKETQRFFSAPYFMGQLQRQHRSQEEEGVCNRKENVTEESERKKLDGPAYLSCYKNFCAILPFR